MRVRICTNPPLPLIKAWFLLPVVSAPGIQTIFSFKSTLCTSIPALRGTSPSSLRLAIDGFELLDNSELSVLRDNDLVCIDKLDVPSGDATQTRPERTMAATRKRKRRASTSSSSSSGSESERDSTTSVSLSESESDSTTSESLSSTSQSESDVSLCPTTPDVQLPKGRTKACVQATPSAPPKTNLPTLVPPGYGKPQTRSRNLRRRLKRVHERKGTTQSEGGPVSGANAVAPIPSITPAIGEVGVSHLMSLSLRNKNKAKNFKSFLNKPLPPKIIFGDEDAFSAPTSGEVATPMGESSRSMARLIPPSSRSSWPTNLFVTSVDVEAGLHNGKKKKKRIDSGEVISADMKENANVTVDYDDMETDSKANVEVAMDTLESIAHTRWDGLAKPTRELLVPRTIVGYKELGINPVTYTPEQCLVLGRVVSCDEEAVVVVVLRGREEVSFSGPVERADDVEERYTWSDISGGDWRVVHG